MNSYNTSHLNNTYHTNGKTRYKAHLDLNDVCGPYIFPKWFTP